MFSTSPFAGKKLILWDFDGCFCDSEPVHHQAYNNAFGSFDHDIPLARYVHVFTHTGQGAAKEIEDYGLPCTPEAIRQAKNIHYAQLIREGKAVIFHEAPTIVEALNKRGILSAIASNSPAEDIEEILSQLKRPVGLAAIFGIEPGLKKKPAPDIYEAALTRLGVPPHDALVIEDSERGLRAAAAAGCQAIWIKTPFTENLCTNAPYIARLSHKEILQIVKE